MKLRLFSLFPLTICVLTNAGAAEIDFARDVRPILSGNCFHCHGPDAKARKAHLRLDDETDIKRKRDGMTPVQPGSHAASELWLRLTTDDPDELMPPPKSNRHLTQARIETIRQWIDQGAVWGNHWAYEVPVRPALPEVQLLDWPQSAIDSFVLKRLEANHLSPSPEADRWTLARRLALDLTGLPPTWEEAERFANDPHPDAYDRYVDAQLAKPSFGERWARVWLDLARYADSTGYADDPPRTIWAYRDWVIRAMNANLPFDQFTIEQIAGDLLESPTKDQLIATAFHRNTMTNNEGGTNNEEFRNVAIVDRVNTTMEVWMGTTMACAQCHDHKYDPITQEEYFQFFDFFNQSEDSDQKDERPVLELWSDAQIEQKRLWEERLSLLKTELATDTPELAAARQIWLNRVRREPVWTPLKLRNTHSAVLEADPETPGWIALRGEKPGNATYVLEFPTPPGSVSGLRLEVSPEQRENFVLSQISAVWEPAQPKPLPGRFIRVELPGEDKMIHLAEIQVFSGGQNIARAGNATQSSTAFDGPANLAIDGNTDGDYAKKSVSHTAAQKDPWFEIDLGSVALLDQIVIWNRTGAGLEQRLAGFHLQVLDGNRSVVWEQSPEVPAPSHSFALSGSRNLDFQTAFADFEQSGFAARNVLAAKPDNSKGWAVGGQTGKPHDLALFLPEPVSLGNGTLTVRLVQNFEQEHHVLTHFRISATSDSNAAEWARMPAGIRELVRKPQPSGPETEKLAAYHRTLSEILALQREEAAKLEKQLTDAKPATTVPIMRDLPGSQQRSTLVQIRGNYKNTGQEVKMGTPTVFHPLREDLPRNRLALANWLIDDANPLTARVVANRYWSQIFGTGIVETSEEFGSQGELPSHPDLLDWLAVELRESGWDLKAFLKLLVTSATYRQSSTVTPELLEADPFNRLLARGPRFRISAEMVRDQALFVSGLLSAKMYGPPVKPPQPELGLKAAFGSATDWQTSKGEDKYRRAIYTAWRRSSPYPSMAAFDAPNREVCTIRRGRTNTPLQALVTLNDPVYVEAAQALARRIASSGQTVEAKARFGFRTCLIREPDSTEIARLVRLFEESRTRFSQQPQQALRLAEEPLGKLPESANPAEMAAWTVVGNVLLNLDEMFLNR